MKLAFLLFVATLWTSVELVADSNTLSMKVIFLLETNSPGMKKGDQVTFMLRLSNRSKEALELQAVRFAGKEVDQSLGNGVSVSFGNDADFAYWDELGFVFIGEGREFSTVVPFPFSGVLAAGGSIDAVATFKCPAEPGLYRVEVRPRNSVAKPEYAFLPSQDDVVIIRPEAFGRVFLERVRVGRP